MTIVRIGRYCATFPLPSSSFGPVPRRARRGYLTGCAERQSVSSAYIRGMSNAWLGSFPRQVIEESRLGRAGADTVLTRMAELMFIDFMGMCFDQIFNQAAKFKYMFGGKAETPVVIRAISYCMPLTWFTMISRGTMLRATPITSPGAACRSLPLLSFSTSRSPVSSARATGSRYRLSHPTGSTTRASSPSSSARDRKSVV